MEYNSSLPIYLQVATDIKRQIVTGRLEPGGKLPSVRDLAISYTVNPNTVSRVYRELEQEEVCFTRRGMGTFVTEDAERIKQMKEEMAEDLVRDFLEGMKQLGFTPEEAAVRLSRDAKAEPGRQGEANGQGEAARGREH